MVSFDKAFGIHAKALSARAKRAEVLANNIANADTPGFKARDIDFKQVLKQETALTPKALQTANANHLSGKSLNSNMDLLYRVPTQNSLDGNTVDKPFEVAQFSQNAMRYQATLHFLTGKIKGLMSAIRGE